MNMVSTDSDDGQQRPLASAAISGGLWTGAQVLANKLVSLLGTVCTMYLLSPEDFGVAAIALSVLAYIVALPAFTMGDVLLARPGDASRVMGTAFRICLLVTIPTVVILCISGFIASSHYGQPKLLWACAIISARPLVDLAILRPQVRMRITLDFRSMAKIDVLTQTGATLGGIAMAACGLGYSSLLVPQVLFTGLRAVLYSRASVNVSLDQPAWISGEWRRLLYSYGLSGLGQYVHGALVMAPPLVIAQYSDDRSVGWYATAFALAASVNTIVAVNIGLVLQPIFAHMASDRARQGTAFVRACAAISAVSIPACICQAVLLGASFRLFLPASWHGAIAMGEMLSLGQALYFTVNPALGLLKAQGRFATFLIWQGVQLAVVFSAMVVAGSLAGDSAAVAIVAVCSAYHLISSPCGIWLCIAGSGQPFLPTLWRIFCLPMIAAAVSIGPIIALIVCFIPAGPAADVVTIIAIPLAAISLYPLSLQWLAPETAAECATMVKAIWKKVLPRGTSPVDVRRI